MSLRHNLVHNTTTRHNSPALHNTQRREPLARAKLPAPVRADREGSAVQIVRLLAGARQARSGNVVGAAGRRCAVIGVDGVGIVARVGAVVAGAGEGLNGPRIALEGGCEGEGG